MVIRIYNYINSSDGQEITRNGWLRAGIADAIKMGSTQLPSLDPFQDISSTTNIGLEDASKVSPQLISPLEHEDSDSDSDWEEIEDRTEDYEDRNIFDVFD